MQNRLVLGMKRKQAGKRLTEGCDPQESNANKLESIFCVFSPEPKKGARL
jgi:hypothetical protein